MFTRPEQFYGLFTGMILLVVSLILPNRADALYLDMNTGLQWLEFSQTRAMRYNNVVAQMVPGGRFEGYRYATADEVGGLFTSFGVSNVNTAENYGPVSSLMGIFGSLDAFPTRVTSIARTGTLDSNGFLYHGYLGIDRWPNCYICTGSARLGSGMLDPTANGGLAMASFLVNEDLVPNPAPVPEPASLLLFASGLAGLVAKRRMRSV